jgi:hypothetical protein
MWQFWDLALAWGMCVTRHGREHGSVPTVQHQVIVLKDMDGRGNSRHDRNVESRWTHPMDAMIKQWIWKERTTVVYALACQAHYLRATRL